MLPRPGPYGPVPWSVPRPWSLWAYATLAIGGGIYYNLTIYGGPAAGALGWLIPAVALYLLLRGSKLMWWVSVVWTSFGLIGTVGGVLDGPDNLVIHQVIVGALLMAEIVMLVMPSTRRFFNLETRRIRTDPLQDRFGSEEAR